MVYLVEYNSWKPNQRAAMYAPERFRVTSFDRVVRWPDALVYQGGDL